MVAASAGGAGVPAMRNVSILFIAALVRLLPGAVFPGIAEAQTFGPAKLLSSTVAASDLQHDDAPDLAGDGAGHWVAVWRSFDELGGTIGGDADILVARSSDDGATWSRPAALNSTAATDRSSSEDHDPRIATDGQGNWIVVWASKYDPATGSNSRHRIYYSTSDDDGQTWSPMARLSSNDDVYDSDAPQIASDGAGRWLAVWHTADGVTGISTADADLRVCYSTDNGATWSAPTALNNNASTDEGWDDYADVAPAGNGDWIAVWQHWDDATGERDIHVARSSSGGAAWTAPAKLEPGASADTGDEFTPQLATDGNGNAVVVFQTAGSSDYDVEASRSTNFGVTWTDAVALNPNAGADASSEYDVHVAADSDGTWLASWIVSGPAPESLRPVVVARSNDAGATWSAPITVEADAAGGYPRIASDGAQAWLVAWWTWGEYNGPIGGDGDILSASSFDDGSNWTAAIPVNSAATDRGGDGPPAVATDRAGHWVVAWDSTDDLGGTIGPDSDLLVRRSSDNGQTWSDVAALNTNAAADSADDHSLALTTDGLGTWIAVWSSGRIHSFGAEPDADILWSRSTDDGASWSAPQILNSYAGSEEDIDLEPRVASDGNGNWVAVWQRGYYYGGTGSDSGDIWFARSTDGGASWSPAQQLNSNANAATADDVKPDVAADGDGSWIVVFSSEPQLPDDPLGWDADILAARSSDGGQTWTAPSPVNTNAVTDYGLDDRPRILTDGSGRWLAVWSSRWWNPDAGEGTDVVYSISADGGSSWQPMQALNSNYLEDSNGPNYWPSIASDGAGTWMVAWQTGYSWPGLGADHDAMFVRSNDSGETWSEASAINTNAASDVGDDLAPQLAADGQGSWIAFWNTDDALGGTASYQVSDVVYATPFTCPSAPLEGDRCLVGGKSKFQIRDDDGTDGDRFSWQWSHGDAFPFESIGVPSRVGGYFVCVYDGVDASPELATSVALPPSPTDWASRRERSWRYRSESPQGSARGEVLSGAEGKTKVRLQVKGAGFLPGPYGDTYFAQNPSVTVQLMNPAGACWSSEFATSRRNLPTSYSASLP